MKKPLRKIQEEEEFQYRPDTVQGLMQIYCLTEQEAIQQLKEWRRTQPK